MAKTSSDARARRLIALLGRLEQGRPLSLTALAEQLGTTAGELAADIETLSMCGVAPYDPFALVPVYVDGDVVEVFGDIPAVRGPVRLSAGEARALATALQSAGFTSDDPLTRRLLDAAASSFDAEDLEHVVRSAIVGHSSSVYEALARALQMHEVVRIEYVSAGTEMAACRLVEPRALFAERGAWYLLAWCRLAGAWRTFRVDRVRSAESTREVFASGREQAPTPGVALTTDDLPLARLRFESARDFVGREWPGAKPVADAAEGSLLVDVPYAGTGWIARKVVARLGSVVVEGPYEVRSAVRELAGQLRGNARPSG